MFTGRCPEMLTEQDLSLSKEYFFRKGSQEVIEFNKESLVKKVTVKKDGVLFCRSRILEGQRFVITGGLENIDLGLDMQLNMMTPVLDRYSPLAHSIALYIHHTVSKHSGIETSYRASLGYCNILQGFGLFCEVAEDCTYCAKLRQKYVDDAMGPISDHQVTVSPPFWVTQCDLDGPINVFVPGHQGLLMVLCALPPRFESGPGINVHTKKYIYFFIFL